ncbi:MAG: alkaline phosphatase [Sandaracinus sp.]|nr:alkaline phosphatase [Sandaracinus sp.]|tara:strand:- start:253 stop:552 length:300 start_codon:yes stop_codon:yes gene_type:complete
MNEIDDATRTELEAAAFRRLVDHLRERTDVQNIDLMNLAGFCRNCLSKWYAAAADEKGLELGYDEAREIVYGMPYAEWKAKHQTPATPEQQAAFDAKQS